MRNIYNNQELNERILAERHNTIWMDTINNNKRIRPPNF